jgi:hypothetical protein
MRGEPQACAARAPVLGHAGTHRVGAVAADEPSILVGDHRSELDAHHAIRAAEGQGCVARQWELLHHSKGDRHAGFQTVMPVIPLKTAGSRGNHTVSSRTLADISAGPGRSYRNAQPSSAVSVVPHE